MKVKAIIRDRGHQLTVSEGDVFEVNRLNGKIGTEVSLNEVLCVDTGEEVRVGQPLLKGAAVHCKIMDHTRGKKVFTFKIKRRKNYRRRSGHRQDLTKLVAKSIKFLPAGG
ncbi:MAG: 50S ribosomal protein L21 [Candidatus Omnitrophica bacterium]|nr:50S ribosomal protein L21 [Candidatus Omnitrophota bacterium]